MISTVAGVILIAAGAIMRFAVPATFAHGLNTHVAGVIVMLAGIVGLLLSLLVWGPLGRRRNRDGGSGRGESPPGTGIPASAPAGRVVLLRVCRGKYGVASECCSGPRQR